MNSVKGKSNPRNQNIILAYCRSETLCEHLLSIVYKKKKNNGPEDDKNGVQKMNVETEARKLCCSILRYKGTLITIHCITKSIFNKLNSKYM